jgi:hypothetical protein
MRRRPRWARFLSEISEWDQRFERDRAPWIELAAGLAALTVVVVSLAAGKGNAGWGKRGHGERTKTAIAERQKFSALLKMLRAGLT